ASAHGCNGTSPGFRSAARFSRCFTGSVGIQNPDRSTLPSDVRGGGALKSILPLEVRGTFFHGYGSHWATAGTSRAVANATTTASPASVRTDTFMMTAPRAALRLHAAEVGGVVD